MYSYLSVATALDYSLKADLLDRYLIVHIRYFLLGYMTIGIRIYAMQTGGLGKVNRHAGYVLFHL